jgi:BTB/POZ domain
MFSLESTGSEIQIEGFETEIVKGMLEYIYTGETESLKTRAMDLLRIAHKYDLGGLKEDCEKTLVGGLNVQNAAETLILAHLHDSINLKTKSIAFIIL